MVGHQDIGMDAAALRFRMFCQPFQVETVVFFSKEAGLAVVAALDDVQRNAREQETGTTRHDNSSSRKDDRILADNRGLSLIIYRAWPL